MPSGLSLTRPGKKQETGEKGEQVLPSLAGISMDSLWD